MKKKLGSFSDKETYWTQTLKEFLTVKMIVFLTLKMIVLKIEVKSDCCQIWGMLHHRRNYTESIQLAEVIQRVVWAENYEIMTMKEINSLLLTMLQL